MRSYSQVSPLFWTRGSGRRLRGDPLAQLVALYLMTCPNARMSGLFYLPTVTIAHETGLDLAVVLNVLDILQREDFAHYDVATELVWVPRMARWQVGETMTRQDKRRRSVLAEVESHIGHRFARDFHRRYAESYDLPPLTSDAEPGPDSIATYPQAPSMGHPTLTEAPSMGHPPSSSRSEPIHNRTGTEQESVAPPAPPVEPVTETRRKRGKGAAGFSPCPPTDASDEDVRAWLERWRIPPEDALVERFLNWHRKSGKHWKDWTATWRDWKARERDGAGTLMFGRAAPVVQSAENRAWKMPEGFE